MKKNNAADALCEWVEMEIGAWTLTGVSFMFLPTVELSKAETLLTLLALFMLWAEVVSYIQDGIGALKRRKQKKREEDESCARKAA